jgi:hypothetical protein
MEYCQGGAVFSGNQTKKRLKEAVREDPMRVQLYGTSSMGSQFNGAASELPVGMTFNVVGPDPYTKRTWYASVKHGPGGKVVVS